MNRLTEFVVVLCCVGADTEDVTAGADEEIPLLEEEADRLTVEAVEVKVELPLDIIGSEVVEIALVNVTE